MASMLSRLRENLDDDLAGQIAALTAEVAALRKAASTRGIAAWNDGRNSTAEIYDDLSGRIAVLMPGFRRQARMIERSARENPGATAAIVGLVIVGLAVALMARRGD